ncbi:hypothetical protein, partial [Campylobacter coli]|uniref:hypothetical protein n=1 Tax=Campylobacter coli TaxID=195 RepID=UPI003F7C4264
VRTSAPLEDDEINLGSQEPEQEVDGLAGLLELGGDDEVVWRITCLSPSAKAGFCTEYNTSDLSLMRIQEEWGGGRYRVQGRNQR